MTPDPPDDGTRYIGRYPVLGELGRGGMGTVYLALDENLDRPVAIKVLPDDIGLTQDDLRRFEREAKTIARLNHPNIATIYEYQREGEHPFIVMELVQGLTLADRLQGGPMDPGDVARLGLQIAEALAAAHAAGIVHRDVKPGNLMISEADRAKLLDFGVAKIRPGERYTTSSDGTTVATTLAGTPGYMSPEQLRREVAGPKTDMWALGCVLYECLAGRPAFGSRQSAGDLESGPDRSALPETTSPALRELVLRLLAYDPDDRPDAETARTVLQRLTAPEVTPEDEERIAAMLTVPPRARRRGRVWALAVSAVLVVASLSLFAAWRSSPRVVVGSDAQLVEQNGEVHALSPTGEVLFRGALPDSLPSPRTDVWDYLAEIEIGDERLILLGPRTATFRWSAQMIVAWRAPRSLLPVSLTPGREPLWTISTLVGHPLAPDDERYLDGNSFLPRHVQPIDVDDDGTLELLTLEQADAWSLAVLRIHEIIGAGPSHPPAEIWRHYHRGHIDTFALGPAPEWIDADRILWANAQQTDEAHLELLRFTRERAGVAIFALPIRLRGNDVASGPRASVAAHWSRYREEFEAFAGLSIATYPELFTLTLPEFWVTESCSLVLAKERPTQYPIEMTPSERGLLMKSRGFNVTVELTEPEAIDARMSFWDNTADACFDEGGLRSEEGTFRRPEEIVERMFHLAQGAPGVTITGNFTDLRAEYAARWGEAADSARLVE